MPLYLYELNLKSDSIWPLSCNANYPHGQSCCLQYPKFEALCLSSLHVFFNRQLWLFPKFSPLVLLTVHILFHACYKLLNVRALLLGYAKCSSILVCTKMVVEKDIGTTLTAILLFKLYASNCSWAPGVVF